MVICKITQIKAKRVQFICSIISLSILISLLPAHYSIYGFCKWIIFFRSLQDLSYISHSLCHATVTLPKPTVGEEILGNLAPILADFLVSQLLFCQSTQDKSFIDRSIDFQGFSQQGSIGR